MLSALAWHIKVTDTNNTALEQRMSTRAIMPDLSLMNQYLSYSPAIWYSLRTTPLMQKSYLGVNRIIVNQCQNIESSIH